MNIPGAANQKIVVVQGEEVNEEHFFHCGFVLYRDRNLYNIPNLSLAFICSEKARVGCNFALLLIETVEVTIHYSDYQFVH